MLAAYGLIFNASQAESREQLETVTAEEAIEKPGIESETAKEKVAEGTDPTLDSGSEEATAPNMELDITPEEAIKETEIELEVAPEEANIESEAEMREAALKVGKDAIAYATLEDAEIAQEHLNMSIEANPEVVLYPFDTLEDSSPNSAVLVYTDKLDQRIKVEIHFEGTNVSVYAISQD